MNNHNRGLADMDGELRAQWGQNYCCVNNMGMKKEIDGALFGCISDFFSGAYSFYIIVYGMSTAIGVGVEGR